MSLREELTGRLEECYELGSNDGDRPNSADATEIINKVLDAAVEAAMGACGNDDGSMYDWQVEEAINKLRGRGM